jgi:hypothetical protein
MDMGDGDDDDDESDDEDDDEEGSSDDDDVCVMRVVGKGSVVLDWHASGGQR